jgi:hypothetical protein
MAVLLGRAQIDPALLDALIQRWLLSRREVSREIVRRGISSGELRAGLDPDIVLDALYGPLYHHLLLPYDPDKARLSDGYIASLIDTVFGGLSTNKRA